MHVHVFDGLADAVLEQDSLFLLDLPFLRLGGLAPLDVIERPPPLLDSGEFLVNKKMGLLSYALMPDVA